MTQTDIKITELMTRLTALERERAAIVAEIETLQSAPSEQTAAIKVIPSEKAGDLVDRNSTIENKIALFRRPFPRPFGCLPHPLGESQDGAQRLRTCLCE